MGAALAAVIGIIVVVGLCWGWARMISRQQADMRSTPPDMRRADDGGDPPYSNPSSPMG